MTFAALWESLLPIGRNPQTGGYRRYTWTEADQQCRGWFREAAAARDLPVTPDHNGNLWAWWEGQDQHGGGRGQGGRAVRSGQGNQGGRGGQGNQGGRGGQGNRGGRGGQGSLGDQDGQGGQGGARPGRETASRPRSGAVVTGSHLDSVPDGGAFDGPLGVVSGFAAIDLLRARGRVPARPIAVAAFCEEEGARFGVACLGSKLLTGAITAKAARALRDADGVTWADAMTAAGYDPDGLGPDEQLLSGIGAFVELHIEQGRALADPPGAAIGIAEGIWPHGRWRFEYGGRADHAGTARLADRSDPMLPYAATVLAARECAARLGTLATFGKIVSEPGGVNAVPSSVRAWLDARAADDAGLSRTVTEICAAAQQAAAAHDVTLTVTAESAAPHVAFDPGLRGRVARAVAAAGLDAPVLPTGAGHDAGVLAARIPTAMLFVRNPAGISHAPAEHAEPADCERGVEALAAVLGELACR